MLEPTLVVAIAAASAKLGAGMDTNLADAIVEASAEPAVNRKPAPPASDVARGSSGAPAMTFKASRRDVSVARIMAFGSSRKMGREQRKIGRPAREDRGKALAIPREP
ncbi:MAG TPA: hypothetical protein VLB05_14295 [Dongiaceae bacterium]|nr:hypothetical protein [Dongiaceae bacterium]